MKPASEGLKTMMSQAFEKKRFIVDPGKYDALCTCGSRHSVPEVKIYSAEDAYSILVEDCKKFLGEGCVLLLDDENTHLAAGERVSRCLGKRSVRHDVLKLPGDSSVTDMLAEKIYEGSSGYHLILSVGAGTINDLAKYVSGRRGIPYWAVPSACSMNGYTSSIAAVKVKGVKRTLPAPPPAFIYVDPAVIQNSPLKLRQAGFCDVLAKSVSDFDWQTESTLFKGSYCRLPSAIVTESEHTYMRYPEKIEKGDREAVLGLFTGLLISGLAMSLAGSSAPASGGEHLFSHFLDMRESLTGRKPELHGLQVGLGIVLSAACYQRLASLEKKDLKNIAGTLFETDFRNISSVWGSLAPEVERQFLKKKERLLQLDDILLPNWKKLRTLFSKVRKPDFFVDLIRRTGFEMTLRSLDLSEDEFLLAAISSRTIRERITILDISAHAGILKKAAEETIKRLS
jgi:glycerol-1-phosphate dehydrogenase [NAD(P)+]